MTRGKVTRRKPRDLPPYKAPDPRPEPRAVLAPTALYCGDNGRIHCGAPRCAGSSAAYTGRGLDGGPVVPIDPGFVARWIRDIGRPPECETCARRATSIASLTGPALTVDPPATLPGDFPDVRDADTARAALDAVIAIVGAAFHNDSHASEYTNADGAPTFTMKEAYRIDRAVRDCGAHLADPYADALAIMRARGCIPPEEQ